jgi:hypothetical protein
MFHFGLYRTYFRIVVASYCSLVYSKMKLKYPRLSLMNTFLTTPRLSFDRPSISRTSQEMYMQGHEQYQALDTTSTTQLTKSSHTAATGRLRALSSTSTPRHTMDISHSIIKLRHAEIGTLIRPPMSAERHHEAVTQLHFRRHV